jgi:DNA-directed RNA polymerase subunit N (RpoN/RPB10)
MKITIKCLNCGKKIKENTSSKNYLKNLQENNWVEHNGKIYCHDCCGEDVETGNVIINKINHDKKII